MTEHRTGTRPLFIAEVKTESPFGFQSQFSSRHLLDLAMQHGDMVALHTDPQWGGSFTWLRNAATYAHAHGKLVLAKGIHPTDDHVRRALRYGADLVLVVGRRPAPELAPVCLIEQRGGIPYRGDKIVVNRRNINTGQPNDVNFGTVRRFCPHTWLCQASFIRTPDDVHPVADAFIVGEHLPEFVSTSHQ